MRRTLRSPIVHRPTPLNATDALPHTNFGDELILGATCGFLNGTGYLDERMLPGSNMLRHKLPPVKLRNSASAPALRDPELSILAEMKAVEGVLGPRGARLAGRLRENNSREKVDVAFAEGDMKALRAAVRAAHWGSRLHKDPHVQQVNAVISKYDKCLIECRDGLAEGDMIRVQVAMDLLNDLAESGLGPRKLENPILMNAKAALDKWAPYRPYLHKLGRARLAGPRPFAQYWLVLVEGTLLSPELEAAATSDLARFGQAGAAALEEAMAVPTVRFHYPTVPWPRKNPLPQQVISRLTKIGIDVTELKMRLVRERDGQSYPERDSPASVLVFGAQSALISLSEAMADFPGEPNVLGQAAVHDTPEMQTQRMAAHRQRLEAARRALDDEEAIAALGSTESSLVLSSTGSIRSDLKAKRLRLRQSPPDKGPWHAPNMFTKTF